jgi:hypothetical protein
MQPPALDVFVEPCAQARPFPPERLVGDLDRVAVDGEQPSVRERLQFGTGVGVMFIDRLGDPETAAKAQDTLVSGVTQPPQQ